MTKNMGPLDRGIRALAAAVIGVLLATGVLKGPAGLVLGIVAVVLLLTGVIGFCSLYVPLGISTRKRS